MNKASDSTAVIVTRHIRRFVFYSDKEPFDTSANKYVATIVEAVEIFETKANSRHLKLYAI